MEAALTALLLGHAPLTALVADRVHWQRLPREVAGLPYVALQTVTEGRGYTYQGPIALRSDRVQIDTWAETAADRLAVAEVLEALLSGYRGTLEGVALRGIFMAGGRDMDDETAEGARQLFRRQQDIFVKWRRA